MDVVGDELNPVVVTPVVEELSLAIEEVFDLALEQQSLDGGLGGVSSHVISP
jgi:hypothetical protein